MAERYTRVYTLESNQYQIDAPVIVAAGALLKDNTNNKVLAQLKFKSISDKIIKALKVSVQPLDVKGEQLGSVVEYQYLDLSAKRDEEFGQKAPIRLPDNNTRQFSVKILESLFEDSTEWKADSFESEIISEPESLADVLHNDSELIEQFRLECGENNTVMPIFHGAYWICSCGAFNRNDETDCHACNKEKSVLINMNLEGLEEKKESRLKNGIYDEAVMLAQEDTVDSLTKAIEKMIGLSDWKDAEQKVKEFENRIKDITYEEAVSLSKQDTIDSLKKAQNIMTDLSGWKNADEEAVSYGKRIESLENKDKADKAAKKKKTIITTSVLCVIIAIAIVVTQFIIPNQKYNEAIALMDDGKYEEAIKAFEGISGFKDSNEKKQQCQETLFKSEFGNPEVGSSIIYGKYEQDNDTSNGTEEIEWIVLAREGNKILVISKYGLDCKPYNTVYTDKTWETSSLRRWLNNQFLKSAFTDGEQGYILTTTVTADKNPEYNTDPGNDIENKVFLLSINEAEKYFTSDQDRQLKATEYAKDKGVYVHSDNGNSGWWLRSPGYSSNDAAYVNIDGSIYCGGLYVVADDAAVRPALWLGIE